MQHDFTDSYSAFLKSMCGYWAPGQDDFLAGEIVHQWSCRQSYRRQICGLEAEFKKHDAVLGDLFYRMKRKLSKAGRNGGWSRWLKQRRIPRATADRLVLEHAEFFGLADELPHRERDEPLEGNVAQAAYRTNDRLENTLTTPRSRMTFIRCLADLLGLEAEWDDTASVRLTIPPPISEDEFKDRAPNIIHITEDGSVQPVDYELKEQDGNGETTSSSPPNPEEVL
jgi:hypothetical protein